MSITRPITPYGTLNANAVFYNGADRNQAEATFDRLVAWTEQVMKRAEKQSNAVVSGRLAKRVTFNAGGNSSVDVRIDQRNNRFSVNVDIDEADHERTRIREYRG